MPVKFHLMNSLSGKMKCSIRRVTRLLLVAASALAIVSNASGQEATKEIPGRYLLIVDVSEPMERYAANVQRTVGNLLYSGMNGQIRPGETIGVWTFDDELHAGDVPLQRWTPQTRQRVAAEVVKFLQQQKYKKPSNFEKILGPLTRLVKDSEKLTVVLVSDGDEKFSGTPFDQLIGDAFRLNSDEQRKQRMPFVTILRSTNGEFCDWKVNTPPWPLEFPEFPPETKSSEIAKVDSDSVKTETRTETPVQPEKKLEVATSTPPPVQTNPPVAIEPAPQLAEKTPPTAPTATESPAEKSPAPSKAESPIAPAPATEAAVAENPPVVPPKETQDHPKERVVGKLETDSGKSTAAVSSPQEATPITPTTNPLVATENSSVAPLSDSTQPAVPSSEPVQIESPVQTAVAPGTETVFSRYGFLAAGIALLLFAFGLLFVLLRRSRETEKVSLITHSMDKK